jgi:hypothetical protein
MVPRNSLARRRLDDGLNRKGMLWLLILKDVVNRCAADSEPLRDCRPPEPLGLEPRHSTGSMLGFRPL